MQCSCTRIYRDRDDRGYAGGCQGNGKKTDSASADRAGVRCGRGASDLADYITGQVISVDGGMHM